MAFVKYRREVSSLPEVTFPVSLAVHALGVTHMDMPERQRQGVFGSGNQDEMDVIGHQAVREDRDFMFDGVFAQ